MRRSENPDVQDWIRDAEQTDIMDAWQRTSGPSHTNLRRASRDLCGPCPVCGGTDRFVITPQRQKFLCRNGGGGGVISMVRHVESCDFLRAVEIITGRPKPGGRAESEQERRDRERRRAEQRRAAEARERQRQEQEARDKARRVSSAGGIWRSAVPFAGSPAESYLAGRGIDVSRIETSQLRFHPALPYPNAGNHPALVARASDPLGKGVGIWRIFLGKGKKGRADVPGPAKLGLGVAESSAVRIGGIAEEIGLAEGIESAAAAAELNGWAFPVWAGLSTSGIQNFTPPEGVLRLWIFADMDTHRFNKSGGVQEPPGLVAAQKLVERLADWPGVATIISRPAGSPESCDWVDILRLVKGLPPE